MNELKWGLAFVPVVVILTLLVAVMRGNQAAIVMATVLATVLLISVGAGIVVLATHASNVSQQRQFRDNAVQDMQLIEHMVRAQNLQLRGQLMQQGRPALGEPEGGLLFDDSLFNQVADLQHQIVDGNE